MGTRINEYMHLSIYNMKIAEVSERYDISLDTLRYYEHIGLIPLTKKGVCKMQKRHQ